MNKQQRQELEDMVRQLAEEPYNPSEKHIEEIKQRAFEEYEQIMAAKQKMKEKRKSTLRHVVVTAAAIVCLLVGSTVIALLNPLQSGNADNFFRRAVIWVNDQLHLGIELPIETNEEGRSAVFNNSVSMKSVLDSAKSLNVPLVYFQENEAISLESINADQNTSTEERVITLRYKTVDGNINIKIQTGADYTAITIHSEQTTNIETPVGTIILWKTGQYVRGIVSLENTLVTISSPMTEEKLIDYCKFLMMIN